MTPKQFKDDLSLVEKLAVLYGQRTADLFHTVLKCETAGSYIRANCASGRDRAEHLQTKHAADWLHRCVMHSHWMNPQVACGGFTPHWKFGIGLDVLKLDDDVDRFYAMCYRIAGGVPVFPPIELDNSAASFTCPGVLEATDVDEPIERNELPVITELRATTSDGALPKYAWPGGYPLFYLDAGNNLLCPKCANANEEYNDKLVAYDVNYEDQNMHCDDCGARIEPAYEADDDDEDAK